MTRKKKEVPAKAAPSPTLELENEVAHLRGVVRSLTEGRTEAVRKAEKLQEVALRQTMELVDLHNELIDLRKPGLQQSKAEKDRQVAESMLAQERALTERLHADREALVAVVIKLGDQAPMPKLGRVSASTLYEDAWRAALAKEPT